MTQAILRLVRKHSCMSCGGRCNPLVTHCQSCLGLDDAEYASFIDVACDIHNTGVDIPENPDPVQSLLLDGLRERDRIWNDPALSDREKGDQILALVDGASRGVLSILSGGKP